MDEEDGGHGTAEPAEAVDTAISHSPAVKKHSGTSASDLELDFASLGHMKEAVQPMLSWESLGITVARRNGSSGAAVAASGCAAEQQREAGDVSPAPAARAVRGDTAAGRLRGAGGSDARRCNLYDVMVHNADGEDATALAHEVLRQAPPHPHPLIAGFSTCVGPRAAYSICKPLRRMLLQGLHGTLGSKSKSAVLRSGSP